MTDIRRRLAAALAALALVLTGLAVVAPTASAQAEAGNCARDDYPVGLCDQWLQVHTNSTSGVKLRYGGANAPEYFVGRSQDAQFLCGSANGVKFAYVNSASDLRVRGYFGGSRSLITLWLNGTGWQQLPLDFQAPNCTKAGTTAITPRWGYIYDLTLVPNGRR